MLFSIEPKKKITNWILLFSGFLIFAYSIFRALFIPFTFDESYSYLEYVRKGIFLLAHYNTPDANNHLLNTWLMELSSYFFGPSVFSLRLPNLFAHTIFIFFSAKLGSKLPSTILIICSFLIINLNPFLLDFFSLARGYGLSLGLLMPSLYYSYKYIKEGGRNINAFIAGIFAAIATVAYFSFINYLLIITFIFCCLTIFDKSIRKEGSGLANTFQKMKRFLLILSPLMVLFLVIPVLLDLRNAHALSFGGSHGFWKDSVVSLIKECLYHKYKFLKLTPLIEAFVASVLILAIYLIIKQINRKQLEWWHSFFVFILVLISMCFIANFIQMVSFGILYPVGRYALIYFPLFVLLMSFMASEIEGKFRKLYLGIIISFTIFFISNFAFSANFYRTSNWNLEADIPDMINYVKHNKKPILAAENNISIGVEMQYLPDINFYRDIHRLDWLNVARIENSYHPLHDYFYLEKSDLYKLKNIPYQIEMEFQGTNTILVSNQSKWKPTEIFSQKLDFENNDSLHLKNSYTDELSFEGNYSSITDTTNKYSDIITYKINDSLHQYKNALLIIRAMVYAKDLRTDVSLTNTIETKGEIYSWQSMNTKDVVKEINKWTPIYLKEIVPAGIKKDDIIKCFFFNTGVYPLYIDDFEVRIIGYEH